MNPPPKLELALAVVGIVWFVLYLRPGFTMSEALVQIALMVLGLLVFAKHWRRFVEKLLWRLRNRLIVAYLLIALVPAVLLTLMMGISAYMVLGQMSLHVLNSQLTRHTAMLHGALHGELPPDERAKLAAIFPGLEVTESNPEWPETDGLVLRDSSLYGWAHFGKLTAVFPLTRDFLGDIAPNLGESVVLSKDLTRTLTANAPRRNGTQNRIPPSVTWIDMIIDWSAPVQVADWNRPGTYIDAILGMRTRGSAVLRTIFPQTMELQIAPMLLLICAVLFQIAVLIVVVVGVNITRTITSAVHDLYEGTSRVRTGDFSHRIPIHGRDQLAELATSFNDMTSNVQRLLEVEKAQQRIQSDLEIAREVQDQLYPQVIPEAEELMITAARSPARLVSGDYYDFQKLANGDVAIVIGDVAGKGISAALLMATLQSSFRMELREGLELVATATGNDAVRSTSVSPSQVVSNLNKHLFEFTSAEKYATFFCGVYEHSSSTLTYTNAGHLPPILVHQGSVHRLEVNGMVVGAFPFAQYNESRLQMHPGDLLVLFTDGISEPENEYGEMFGEDQLAELVARNAQTNDDALVAEILDAVRQWTGSEELQDDMTLLLVRRRPV